MADFVEIAVNTTDAVVPLVEKLIGSADKDDEASMEVEFSEQDLEFQGAEEILGQSEEMFLEKVKTLPYPKVQEALFNWLGLVKRDKEIVQRPNFQPPKSISLLNIKVKYEAFLLVVYYVAKMNTNIKAINLDECHLHEEHCVALGWALQFLPELVTLSMDNNPKIKELGCAAICTNLEHCKNLQRFVISNCQIRDLRGDIGNMLERNKELNHLNVEDNKLGRKACTTLADALGDHINLLTLDMHDNIAGDIGCALIMEALQRNIVLEALLIGENGISSASSPAIKDMLQNNHSLTKLELQKNKLHDAGVEQISLGLKENNTLKTLRLGQNGVGDVGTKALADALEGNTTLQFLYLPDNVIDDDGFCELIQFLKTTSACQLLDISRNKVDDEGGIALGEVLAENNSLTDLILDGNGFSDASSLAIANGLKTNTTLTRLSMARCAVGDEGASALAYTLANEENTTLKTLELDENPINKKVQEGWVKAANLRGATGPSMQQLNITTEGTNIASNSLKTFGVKINNSETRTTFSKFWLFSIIFTNWFDLATDVLVVYELYTAATVGAASYAWFGLSFSFLLLPTLYMMIYMSSAANYEDDTKLNSIQNALLSLFQLRVAYEAYQSYKYHETTTRLASIRVVEVAGESGPQSFLQINFLIYFLARPDSQNDVSSAAVILSVCLSLIVLGTTLSDLFERQYVYRHTKHTDSYGVTVRLFPCIVFHIAQFIMRALTIALLSTLFTPGIAIGAIVFAIMLRFGIWFITNSERGWVFCILVTFLANSAWDTKLGVGLGVTISTIELICVCIAMFFFPSDVSAPEPSWLWNTEIDIDALNPEVMAIILGSLFLFTYTIFFTYIVPKHEYGLNRETQAAEVDIIVPEEVPSEMLEEDEKE